MPYETLNGSSQPELCQQGIDYDQLAETYVRQRDASPFVTSHIIQTLGEMLPGEILEIGCGTADYLLALSRSIGTWGCGFDRSPGMLRRGLEKNPGLQQAQADAAAVFPLQASRFDFAFSMNVIHYIDDLVHFFGQVWRVLRPGGLVLTVTDSENDIRQRTMSRYFPESVNIELSRYHRIAAIQGAMEEKGFTTVWVTHTDHHPLVMDEMRLERYRNKAFSALTLLPEAAFQRGLRRLEGEVSAGICSDRELYSYVWGRKASDSPAGPG